jgi:hypothetical protein
VLRLRGGSFSACPGTAAQARCGGGKPVRRLFGKGHGRFRTSGRYSATTVRGTVWRVEDRCDGTLTTVERGSAVIYDFVRKRRVTVTAGKKYLARLLRPVEKTPRNEMQSLLMFCASSVNGEAACVR